MRAETWLPACHMPANVPQLGWTAPPRTVYRTFKLYRTFIGDTHTRCLPGPHWPAVGGGTAWCDGDAPTCDSPPQRVAMPLLLLLQGPAPAHLLRVRRSCWQRQRRADDSWGGHAPGSRAHAAGAAHALQSHQRWGQAEALRCCLELPGCRPCLCTHGTQDAACSTKQRHQQQPQPQ